MDYFKKIIIALLHLEARAVLLKYKPRVVVVTGSVGKTSTKDAIHTVLSTRFKTRKSLKSFNSDIGVPLAILDCPNGWRNPLRWILNLLKGLFLVLFPHHFPEWLVLELGADKPGDLGPILEWLHPDITVVTRFPEVPVHVEFYESPEALNAEESLPVFAVKEGGVVILNADDDAVMALEKDINDSVVTYGTLPQAQVRSISDEITYAMKDGRKVPTGMTFTVTYGEETEAISLQGAIGIQHVYPVLAAFVVGTTQGISLKDVKKAISNHVTPPGRMHLLSGIKGTTIIDDSYNSSPVAVREALLTLKRLESSGRKIAILGDMLELGNYSSDEHRKAGLLAGECADILITVGIKSRGIAEAGLDAKIPESNVFQFDNSEEADVLMEKIIQPGDTILVKGSQSMRMEKIVEDIMEHPEDKEKLLV